MVSFPTTEAEHSSALQHTCVSFTGTLANMTQREAFELVQARGGEAAREVSRRTTHLVVGMRGWPMLPDGRLSRKLEQVEQLKQAGHTIAVVSEQRFLELAGERMQPIVGCKQFPSEQVCQMFSIEPAALERWVQLGLLQPVEDRYDFQDLVSLRTLLELLGRGVRPDTISASLAQLAQVLPAMERPLAQLELIIRDEHEVLVRHGQQLMALSGQLLLDFEKDAADADDAEPLPWVEASYSADDWYEAGVQLEQAREYARAKQAYTRAVQFDAHFAEAVFNLGNVCRLMGDLDAAQAHYHEALRLDANWPQVSYNIADVCAEQGRLNDAVTALTRALACDFAYADAHYNMAWCLQRLGREQEAVHHWRMYLQLEPEGMWAVRARQYLALAI